MKVRSPAHANCVVCSSLNEHGLGLSFKSLPDGSVEATFDCNQAFEGYRNVLHGGITSTLLDGAMTNCMFAHGIHAVTAELNIRFLHPVACCLSVTVRAWITRSSSKLHLLKAEISQNDQIMATATGKFVRIEEQPDPDSTGVETATTSKKVSPGLSVLRSS
ncbi:MAG: hotdog fold thioesterase [Candidatus Aegiribacteria sp.]|nr:hotdog fold thioesterase [Candidatus Aegiribacteria sp.]